VVPAVKANDRTALNKDPAGQAVGSSSLKRKQLPAAVVMAITVSNTVFVHVVNEYCAVVGAKNRTLTALLNGNLALQEVKTLAAVLVVYGLSPTETVVVVAAVV
jgi:hypothetical protein